MKKSFVTCQVGRRAQISKSTRKLQELVPDMDKVYFPGTSF